MDDPWRSLRESNPSFQIEKPVSLQLDQRVFRQIALCSWNGTSILCGPCRNAADFHRDRRRRIYEAERPAIGYLMTATLFGRPRRWFQCPGCARRCRVLYGGKRFRCRQCHGLRYECQSESPAERASRQQRKVRRRLGGSTNLLDEFPPKPSGMHRTTYQRLEALDDDMQSIWVRSVFELIGRRRS